MAQVCAVWRLLVTFESLNFINAYTSIYVPAVGIEMKKGKHPFSYPNLSCFAQKVPQLQLVSRYRLLRLCRRGSSAEDCYSTFTWGLKSSNPNLMNFPSPRVSCIAGWKHNPYACLCVSRASWFGYTTVQTWQQCSIPHGSCSCVCISGLTTTVGSWDRVYILLS